MSGIESKIGKMPMSVQPVRHMVVDDPTAQQEMPQEKPPLPKVNEWTKMSPQQYNDMRRFLSGQAQITGDPTDEQEQETMRFSSTEDLQVDKAERKVVPEDAALMDMLVTSSKAKNRLAMAENQLKKDQRNKIEILLGLRKKTAQKEIEGHTIVLRNLRSNQTRKVLEEVANETTGFSRLYSMKHMVVGLALESIDGESVHSILGEDDSDELRIDLVSNMDPSIVDELYDMYVKDIGNKLSINSEAESKESIEEIKKS